MPDSLKLTDRQNGRPAPLGQQESFSPWMFLPEMLFKWHLFVHKQELRKVTWHLSRVKSKEICRGLDFNHWLS